MRLSRFQSSVGIQNFSKFNFKSCDSKIRVKLKIRLRRWRNVTIINNTKYSMSCFSIMYSTLKKHNIAVGNLQTKNGNTFEGRGLDGVSGICWRHTERQWKGNISVKGLPKYCDRHQKTGNKVWKLTSVFISIAFCECEICGKCHSPVHWHFESKQTCLML